MERNTQRSGLINLLILVASCVTAAFMVRYAQSATAATGAVFLGIGLLVAAISYFQMGLENRERVEKMEFDEMVKDRKDAALFAGAEQDTFIARKSREQFERFFVPGFTIALFVLQSVAVYWLWKWLAHAPAPNLGNAAVTMVVFGAFSLVLYLLGKYASGMAQMDKLRLLRPGGAYLLLGAVMSVVIIGTEAAAWFDFPKIDLYAARVLTVFLGLSAAETLVNLVLEIYRPRTRGKAERVLYESRLVALLGQPAGLVTTAAQALDYQFGFKVSETWFYKFIEKAFAWLILLQVGILALSTTFVIIEPHEQAVLERFGRPPEEGAVLRPGLHFKLPWPIDKVYRRNANEIQDFYVGYKVEEGHEQSKTILWTVSHYEEELNFLVASREQVETQTTSERQQAVPVNLLAAAIPVQYRVKDLEAWVYHYKDPAKLISDIGNREVVRYLASVDLLDIMSSGRLKASTELKRRIQEQADRHNLGVEILFVGLQDIHPPVGTKQTPVAAAFEAVVGAIQDKEAHILKAEAYAAEVLPKAAAEAAKLLSEAEGYRVERIKSAMAQSRKFLSQLKAYQTSPEVFQNRQYFDVMARALTNVRKYVMISSDIRETYYINLEDKIAYDLLQARPQEER